MPGHGLPALTYTLERLPEPLCIPWLLPFGAGLAINVYLDAWLHLQTDHQYYAPVPPGAELIAESRITDLFNKKGHEFVDLDVNVFFKDGSAAMSTRLRAIYRLGATKENRETR